ncbi:MAG: SIS domain-containing protein [Opitutaceae bacterium]
MSDQKSDPYDSPYLQDILDQPRALAATIEALRPRPEFNALFRDLREGRRRRIVLTGMGGSFAVLHPLHLRLIDAGFDSIMVETSELLYAAPRLLAPENAVVAVSQSGSTAETMRLLERKVPGSFIVGITNTPDSPLARRADLAIVTLAGPEFAVSCKTSVTALVALDWLAEHGCGGRFEDALGEYRAMPAAFDSYLVHWKEHVDGLRTTLRGVRSFFTLGRGRSLTAANLGGMIPKEAAHVHGEGMSSAAFRHGAVEMLASDVFTMVFEGDPAVSAFNRGMFQDILDHHGRAALVGREAPAGPFRLPAAPARALPALELLPPQMASLAFAALGGRRPAQFERLEKVTTVE